MKTTLAVLHGEGFSSEIVLEVMGGREAVTFIADADIDADGSPHAYHPGDTGTDYLANARDARGNLVGVLTRNGEAILQGTSDPAPGYYISTTAYEWPDEPEGTQRRYVDGEKIAFAVVPPLIVRATAGIVKGCLCRVTNIRNGKVSTGMVADIGPSRKDGEISPQMARELGLDPSPKHGGTDDHIIKYEIYPGCPALVNGRRIALMRSGGGYLPAETLAEIPSLSFGV